MDRSALDRLESRLDSRISILRRSAKAVRDRAQRTLRALDAGDYYELDGYGTSFVEFERRCAEIVVLAQAIEEFKEAAEPPQKAS